MGIIQDHDRAFKKWAKLNKEAEKIYHAYEIANSKRRKAWEIHLKNLRSSSKKKGRK